MAKNIVKSCWVILMVLGLFVSSCKKSTPTQEAAPSASEQKAVEVPAQQQPVAAAPEAKPAEVPKAEPDKETAASAGMAALDIKLPKPMFIGTPEMVTVENLEKPTGELRGLFYAPEGTVNVAAGKTVTSNQEPIIGDLGMITDGDKEAADGSFVEFGPSLTYVTIDFGSQCDIYAIVMWHYHQQARVYYDVVVQVSDDPDFIKDVKTLFNNDIDNTAGQGVGTNKNYTETFEGRLIDAKGAKGRYVRLYSNGNTGNEQNHYIEVEVYGKPAK